MAMDMGKRGMHVATVVVLALLGAAEARGVVLDIDAGDAVGATRTGSWSHYDNPTDRGSIDDSYFYSQTAGSQVTYTPGNVPGFVPTVYDIYVTWSLYSSHTTNAVYTVNHTGGSTALPAVNQKLTAAQGAANAIPYIYSQIQGGGLYYLGQFELDASSTITMAWGIQEGALIADGILLMSPDEGRLFDERSGNVTVSNPDDWTTVGTVNGENREYTASPVVPGLPYLAYHYSYIGSAELTFRPLAGGSHLNNPLDPGRYRVDISWAAYFLHATNALFVVDINGDGDGDDAGEGVFTIDQRKLADGTQLTTSGDGTVWSDYYDLGLFNLNASSRIIVRRDNPQANVGMSVDVLRLTYTPPRGTLFRAK